MVRPPIPDRVRIDEADKERIYEKGFDRNTGLGLFLSRKIRSFTGIGIIETGQYGRGAWFEIPAPNGTYRFTRQRKR